MNPRWLARPAVPADHPVFVRLFPELGVDDPILDPARWEADMAPGTTILEHAGAPVAYAWSRHFGEAGYVFNVVVDPAFRGRGAGGALMEAVAGRLRALGCTRWSLNVKVDNGPAIRLYERWGLRRAYRSVALVLRWDHVAALPRDDAPEAARPIEPGDDAAVEAAFSVIPGRLADFREKGRVVLGLFEPERPAEPAGLACFNPSFPGAFPFAVARPALAAPLLDALRPHARPGDAELKLVIERDAALVAALRDAGAAVRLELFHMEGSLETQS